MTASGIAVSFPTADSDCLRADVARVISAVTAAGGAVGWLAEATRAETDAWLAPVLAQVAVGDAVLCLATVEGRVQAMGAWVRQGRGPMRQVGEITKVMAHPAARGRRLGHAVMEGLVTSAQAAGLELLTLGCRGNNHLAIGLYREHGFHEWGRLPHAVAVGADRWDDVRMCRELARPDGVRLRGGEAGGPGGSPAP